MARRLHRINRGAVDEDEGKEGIWGPRARKQVAPQHEERGWRSRGRRKERKAPQGGHSHHSYPDSQQNYKRANDTHLFKGGEQRFACKARKVMLNGLWLGKDQQIAGEPVENKDGAELRRREHQRELYRPDKRQEEKRKHVGSMGVCVCKCVCAARGKAYQTPNKHFRVNSTPLTESNEAKLMKSRGGSTLWHVEDEPKVLPG